MVEQTDEGQEMVITPLLTSVENAGFGDVLWKKYFWGEVAGRIEAEIKRLLLIYARKVGFPGHVFGEIFFWGRDLIVEF